MKHEGRLEGRELTPRSARIDVGWIVLIDCPAGKFRAEMLNVSARGFRLRAARALEPGWEVGITFGKDAPVKGIVQWVEGKHAGGAFAEPVAL
jgi:hypothetical protein